MSGALLRAQAAYLVLSISRQKHDTETQLETVQQQLDSLVYPVLTLPHEITSEIFVYCLPAEPSWIPDTMEAPLLLMHVCSAWRNIAVSTPTLWSTLEIEAAAKIAPHFSEIINVWLSRAKQCPLSVKIDGPLSYIHHFRDLLKAFRRHSQTMRCLDLTVTDDDLEHMNTRQLSDPTTMFYDVPALREVLLAECPPSFVILPWNQLTKFTGDCITAADCAKALRLMPKIVECRFSTTEEFDHTTPALLPSENRVIYSVPVLL
ncbi:hypothetical protein B0H17DRAFT_1058554 [Mycena rosella]|uniref:F-box domain-containing protein n=1 Tax=Mycena rosella TaxID=1033263 RepID=A0AAD7DL65_MYCRO|nr:hypothetical protein B0H17DRAFT_1058554 [Mycena rosella]